MAKYYFFQLVAFSLLYNFSTSAGSDSTLTCLNPEIFNETEYEFQNDTLYLNDLNVSKNYYEFNGSQVRACLCKLTPCLRKCCSFGEVYNLSKRKCEFNENSTDLVDVLDRYQPLTEFTSKFRKVYGLKCPNSKYRTYSSSGDSFSVQTNGSLLLKSVNGTKININILDSDEFCLEEFTDNNGSRFLEALICHPKQNGRPKDARPEFTIYPAENFSQSNSTLCSGFEKNNTFPFFELFFCSPEDGRLYPKDSWPTSFIVHPKPTVYPIGMIISSLFLFITILIHIFIPELKNIHGKFLICHTTSLLNLYIFLIIIQIQGPDINPTFCVICGYIIQFSFLATFFWLNVMCIDIWWTFSEFRKVVRRKVTSNKKDFNKFLIYSCYGWGSPTIILIITMILDLHPDIPDHIITANVGKKRCLVDVENKLPALIYLYGPVGILLFLNLLSFLWTIIKLCKNAKKAKILYGEESHRNMLLPVQFVLYLKLFIVMGINWTAELISWAIEGPNWIWWTTDILNTLQGIFIFAIFAWNERFRKLILLKICPRRVQQNGNRTTFMTTSRSSSKKNANDHTELKSIKTKRNSENKNGIDS